MKPFDQWFNEAWKAVEVKEPELPDGLEILSDGTLQSKCVICNEHYQFLGEPTKFTKEYSYCYGSERCCP